ncbi:MAG: hypothetical protein ACOYOK_02565 [Pseudobdellovibrionaceae bacterium]
MLVHKTKLILLILSILLQGLDLQAEGSAGSKSAGSKVIYDAPIGPQQEVTSSSITDNSSTSESTSSSTIDDVAKSLNFFGTDKAEPWESNGIACENCVKDMKLAKESIDNDASFKNTYLDTNPIFKESMTALSALVNKYLTQQPGCATDQKLAASWCLEDSPHIQGAMSTIQLLTAGINKVAINDSCSKISKALDVADKALTAYKLSCGAAKGYCVWNCNSTRKTLIEIQKNAGVLTKKTNEICARYLTVPNANLEPTEFRTKEACLNVNQGLNSQFKKIIDISSFELGNKSSNENYDANTSVSKKYELCFSKYQHIFVSAGVTAASVLLSSKSANSCKEQTAAASGDKCQTDQYKNSPECLCLNNPRMPGCSNSLSKAGETQAQSLSSSKFSSGSANDSSARGATGAAVDGSFSGAQKASAESDGFANNSSGGLPGAPAGGGGSGFDTGSNLNGAENHQGEVQAKGLNANILSGAGGGGGGGWGGGGSGDYKDSQYRAYLPGGEKDPARSVASDNAPTQVSGQGGKSNWEKVSDRYRENKTSLLGGY